MEPWSANNLGSRQFIPPGSPSGPSTWEHSPCLKPLPLLSQYSVPIYHPFNKKCRCKNACTLYAWQRRRRRDNAHQTGNLLEPPDSGTAGRFVLVLFSGKGERLNCSAVIWDYSCFSARIVYYFYLLVVGFIPLISTKEPPKSMATPHAAQTASCFAIKPAQERKLTCFSPRWTC